MPQLTSRRPDGFSFVLRIETFIKLREKQSWMIARLLSLRRLVPVRRRCSWTARTQLLLMPTM